MSEEEEARLAAYRRQAARRAVWQQTNRARLAGDPTAARAVTAAWQPVIDAQKEARRGNQDAEDAGDGSGT